MAIRRERFARRRKACGFNQEDFSEAVGVDRTTVQRWENGTVSPHPWQRPKIAKVLDIPVRELESLLETSDQPHLNEDWLDALTAGLDDETAAWELARRVQASDVGTETLDRLDHAFDELAIAYPTTPPQELLGRVRRHSAYVARLLDARKTLAEHRRLLVVGGWLSLFGATLHIDLKQDHAATARLQTAAALAHQAEHREITAWCLETDAWRVLSSGDHHRAVELSRTARSVAPNGTSVLVQATAQEGRALARLGRSKETYRAIERVHTMSASRQRPDHPEHHYRYDPDKTLAYTATTLAWLGDVAAEPYAREVIARLSPGNDSTKWPRRVASAHIDLSLALLAGDRLDEACDAVQQAILSGRVVPSNHWRALEVVQAVEKRNLPEATDVREAFRTLQTTSD